MDAHISTELPEGGDPPGRAVRLPRFDHLKSEISNLKSLAESVSRQLRAWADSLQNSDIAGPRHLNEKTRANYQKATARKQGAADFQALLAQHLPPDHPARKI